MDETMDFFGRGPEFFAPAAARYAEQRRGGATDFTCGEFKRGRNKNLMIPWFYGNIHGNYIYRWFIWDIWFIWGIYGLYMGYTLW